VVKADGAALDSFTMQELQAELGLSQQELEEIVREQEDSGSDMGDELAFDDDDWEGEYDSDEQGASSEDLSDDEYRASRTVAPVLLNRLLAQDQFNSSLDEMLHHLMAKRAVVSEGPDLGDLLLDFMQVRDHPAPQLAPACGHTVGSAVLQGRPADHHRCLAACCGALPRAAACPPAHT
jgi:hypothetical protein